MRLEPLIGIVHRREIAPHPCLTAEDLAVVTWHVEQASAVAACLAGVPGVLVATANQAQWLEREAVVVIHPLAGYREASSLATDPGCLGWPSPAIGPT